MNKTERILLRAIQKNLWHTDVAFEADVDWNAVLAEAEAQSVLGHVLGVAPQGVQQAWKSKADAGMARFVRVLHYQQRLTQLLEENDIPMVILKGTAAAICAFSEFSE